jgi:hypothetical protein
MIDHCVFDYSRQPNRFQCLHCGAEQLLQLPIPISRLVNQSDDWIAEHRRCRPTTPTTTDTP